MVDVKVDKGVTEIYVRGGVTEIVADTATIIKAVYEGIGEKDKELSEMYKEYVCECIDKFFLTEKELDKEIEKLQPNDMVLKRFFESE